MTLHYLCLLLKYTRLSNCDNCIFYDILSIVIFFWAAFVNRHEHQSFKHFRYS